MEENDDSVGSTIFQWCVILFLSFILVSSALIEAKVVNFPPEETSIADTLSLWEFARQESSVASGTSNPEAFLLSDNKRTVFN